MTALLGRRCMRLRRAPKIHSLVKPREVHVEAMHIRTNALDVRSQPLFAASDLLSKNFLVLEVGDHEAHDHAQERECESAELDPVLRLHAPTCPSPDGGKSSLVAQKNGSFAVITQRSALIQHDYCKIGRAEGWA